MSPPRKEGVDVGETFMQKHAREQRAAVRHASPTRGVVRNLPNTTRINDFMSNHCRSVPARPRVDDRARAREANAPGLSTDDLNFQHLKTVPKVATYTQAHQGVKPNMPTDDFMLAQAKSVPKLQGRRDIYSAAAPKMGTDDFMLAHVKSQKVVVEVGDIAAAEPPKTGGEDFMMTFAKSVPQMARVDERAKAAQAIGGGVGGEDFFDAFVKGAPKYDFGDSLKGRYEGTGLGVKPSMPADDFMLKAAKETPKLDGAEGVVYKGDVPSMDMDDFMLVHARSQAAVHSPSSPKPSSLLPLGTATEGAPASQGSARQTDFDIDKLP
jgi:hypothetical protein